MRRGKAKFVPRLALATRQVLDLSGGRQAVDHSRHVYIGEEQLHALDEVLAPTT